MWMRGNGSLIFAISIVISLGVIGTPAQAQTILLTENFDDVSSLASAGWVFTNTSTSPNLNWFQGLDTEFSAQSGASNAYIMSSTEATTGDSADETISNWLLTPEISLSNDVAVTFWTRTVDPPAFPDRFEMRFSTQGSSTNVGTTPLEVGDFTSRILEINPTQTATDYPSTWTEYTVFLSGISTPTTGRIGFRHYVTNAGLSGQNGDHIGVDSVMVSRYSVVPETGTAGLLVLGGIFSTSLASHCHKKRRK